MGYTCGTSSLQIRDGQSSSSNLLKKFCGSEYESSVFSSSRYLLVQFDSKKEYLSGKSLFDAVFEAVKQGKEATASKLIPTCTCQYNDTLKFWIYTKAIRLFALDFYV